MIYRIGIINLFSFWKIIFLKLEKEIQKYKKKKIENNLFSKTFNPIDWKNKWKTYKDGVGESRRKGKLVKRKKKIFFFNIKIQNLNFQIKKQKILSN